MNGIKLPTRIIILHHSKKLAEITVKEARMYQGLKVYCLARKPIDPKPGMENEILFSIRFASNCGRSVALLRTT